MIKDREQLVITPRNLSRFGSVTIAEGQTEVDEEHVQMTLRYVPASAYKLNTKPHVAALDAGLLKFPLKLRSWQEGDWFVPLGMNGKKKISDFLIDKKIPANLKAKTLVLVSDQSIVWIAGHRLDNRFKVTEKTEQVLEISLKRTS
ncbi:tRNA lysidine(34) synthetase TilS [Pontibacter sp. BAB1700]|uniref:tRNA lysidine(34) synthetase TilS n=1 Tax=Pontibacter sp. BAB1700 TaxID=1144253 RepID=UPI000685D985|nr:tRNA lysidine(34) synthetase TilS [Pontibacter sp. BAB1700]